VDTAESWLHGTRHVVTAAEEAETEYFDAQKLADEMLPPEPGVLDLTDAGEDAARDSIQPPLTPGERPDPVAETPRGTSRGTITSPPPSSRPSERARRYVRVTENAARHVGPSVSETAAAAASLASALTSLAKSSSPGVDALDRLLGACAGLLTHKARGATAPFSLEGLLADAAGDIEKLAADCVASA
jgi:hypothetical protein